MNKLKLSGIAAAILYLIGIHFVAAEDIIAPESSLIANKIAAGATPGRINCTGKLGCSLSLTTQFYLGESSVPVWTKNGELLPSALDMLAVIRNSYLDGLNPLDYHLNELNALKAKITTKSGASFAGLAVSPEDLADFDVTLSDAFLLYAKHSVYGRVNNAQVYPNWIINKRSENLMALLAEATHNNSITATLNQLQPRYSGYAELKIELNHYQNVAIAGGWESIPAVSLKVGAKGKSVTLLQKRLAMTTESEATLNFKSGVFDNNTRKALLEFQTANGLKGSGQLDAKTRQTLNIPVRQRIKLIELNMDRLRWLPLDIGWRYILVNIPDFSLNVVKDNQTILAMPVIVGKGTNRSCILSSKITYLELNPYWTIPDSLAKKELLPKLKQNPNYLAKDQIKVYTSFDSSGSQIDPLKVNWLKIESANLNYKFRQDPGLKNSLGRVKFIFPNDCGIYLHDTPSRNLFVKNRRDFSHGCIRIGKPLEMADYLLSDKPNWTPARIESQIEAGKRQVVFLADPISIHILYATVWRADDGQLQFRNDIYGIDNVDYPVYLPATEQK